MLVTLRIFKRGKTEDNLEAFINHTHEAALNKKAGDKPDKLVGQLKVVAKRLELISNTTELSTDVVNSIQEAASILNKILNRISKK